MESKAKLLLGMKPKKNMTGKNTKECRKLTNNGKRTLISPPDWYIVINKWELVDKNFCIVFGKWRS